jgi:hypothetical protein
MSKIFRKQSEFFKELPETLQATPTKILKIFQEILTTLAGKIM